VWRETRISRKRGLMASKKARDEIVNFFDDLEERKFTDASRTLQAIRKKKFGDADFTEGYIKALEGVLLSARTGDERDFLNRAPFDAKAMERYQNELKEFVKNGVHSPFDVGFFLAWSDLIRYRLDTKKKG
jgi:hypothetical protein